MRPVVLIAFLACSGCAGDGSPGLADGGGEPVDGSDAAFDPDAGGDGDLEGRDGDPETGVDGGADAEPEPGTGGWDAPIVVDELPFIYRGDTREAVDRVADEYLPCGSGIDESGPEIVFELRLAEAARIWIEVDDHSGDEVDVDVHLLDGPRADACLARDNVSLVASLEAGVFWVVVDTWVDAGGQELAGPFVLRISAEGGTDDCTTSPIDCTETDVPSPNGVPAEAAGGGGCPPGMVLVDDFCIDRYEAMLVEVLAGGTLAPWSPYLSPGSRRVRALSVAGVVPQGYVSGEQAAAACAEAGKRLCSDAEWQAACGGAGGRTYPDGGETDEGQCNTTRACHPAEQLFETTADWIWSELGNPCLNQLPDGLATTGDFTACVTPEGVHDLVGNLHEWTAAPTGTFRGGFYVDAIINGAGCLYRTTAHDRAYWDYSTGFRCCADR